MTKTQNEALQFLGKFKCSNDEQLKYFTGCSNQDINYLIMSGFIVRDEKTNLLHHKTKKVNVRNVVALDVIKLIKNEIKQWECSRNYPVIFSIITIDNELCDIAVVRQIEQETVFKELEKKYSKADKIIIVLENENFDRNIINTTKQVLICKYPIEIIDKIN